MNITEARQMLESHSITEDNYAGFRTVHRKRQYARGTYIATAIKVTKSEGSFSTASKTVNQFVTRKVNFNSDGTYVVSDIEGLMPIAEMYEGQTLGQSAKNFEKLVQRNSDIKDRLNNLFVTEGDFETRCDSRRIFNARVNEALGLTGKHVDWNNSDTAPEFTITLSLAEVEALLAMKVGA